jgi:hypothetical protein
MATGNFNKQTYYTVRDGKIVREYSTPTNNSIPRINKVGRTVHEEFFDFLTGYITNITIKVNEDYGNTWQLEISDDLSASKSEVVQFPYSGGLASSLLKTLPNISFGSPIMLVPKLSVVGDKKRSSFLIKQGSNYLKHFWTKDNPGEMPPLKKVKIKGKESWDDSEQLEFFEKYVNQDIQPLISRNKNGAPKLTEDIVDIDEEIPF